MQSIHIQSRQETVCHATQGLGNLHHRFIPALPQRCAKQVLRSEFPAHRKSETIMELYARPYWFFGMLMEMYVIYRLLIYNRKDWVAIVLTVFSIVVMALLPPESLALNYLRINCFLAILPFCMGVLAARHLNANSFSINNASACVLWFALGFVFLTASKFNYYSWLIMPIFIIITAVTLVKLINRSNILGKVLGWCGTMSAILFVVHPTVREIMIERINATGNYYGMLAVYLFVTFGLSIILKPVFSNKKEKTDDDKPALSEGAQVPHGF